MQIIAGDSLAVLPTLPDNSIDAIVTDPPYGIKFMSKAWDDAIAFRPDVWRECLRVLKPGGHIAVFGGSRTHHRVWVAVEDAGFEIRDTLMWVYGSGFPKSLDVSKAIDHKLGHRRGTTRDLRNGPDTNPLSKGIGKFNEYPNTGIADLDEGPATPQAEQWQGWGTALKPSHEPILLGRKPLIGTVAQNVLTHGTGALNIDACRVGTESTKRISNAGTNGDGWGMGTHAHLNGSDHGRWPPNLLLSNDEEVLECFPQMPHAGNTKPKVANPASSMFGISGETNPKYYQNETDHSAARFFPSLGFTDDERRIQGWETALKPSHEPILLARKPLEGNTVAENVLAHGTGGINVDACRVLANDSVPAFFNRNGASTNCYGDGLSGSNRTGEVSTTGRWPPNLLHDGSDEVVGFFPHTKSGDLKPYQGAPRTKNTYEGGWPSYRDVNQKGDEGSAARFFPALGFTDDELKPSQTQGRWPTNLLLDGSEEVIECFPSPHGAGYRKNSDPDSSAGDSMFGIGGNGYGNGRIGDEGSAARFFPALGFTDDERRILYCPKASKRDRAGSKHPTIKPIKLMEWLCKLICPPNGTILDPFAGSGTTGQAAINLGFACILIEQSEEYVADIQRRMGQSDDLVTFTR